MAGAGGVSPHPFEAAAAGAFSPPSLPDLFFTGGGRCAGILTAPRCISAIASRPSLRPKPSAMRILELFLRRPFQTQWSPWSVSIREDVAGLDGVAFLDQPFGQRPLLHRRRQCGHLELVGIGFLRERREATGQAQAGAGSSGGQIKLGPLALRRALTQHFGPWRNRTICAPSGRDRRQPGGARGPPLCRTPRCQDNGRIEVLAVIEQQDLASGRRHRRRARKNTPCASKSSARRSAKSRRDGGRGDRSRCARASRSKRSTNIFGARRRSPALVSGRRRAVARLLVANFTGIDAGKLPCPVMLIPGGLSDERLEQLS